MTELVVLRIADEADVFEARRRGREVAAAVGLENQDQVRTVTALSEISRELVALPEPASVVLSLTAEPEPALVVTARWVGHLGAVEGITAARRLMDSCTVDAGSVALTKRLPAALTPDRLDDLRARLGGTRHSDPLAVLRDQNRDLVDAMDALARRQKALAALTRASLAMNAAADVAGALAAVATGAAELTSAPARAQAGELVADDGVLGPSVHSSLVFRSRGGSPLTITVQAAELQQADTDMLTQLGQAAASTLDALRLQLAEHDLVLTLQRSFLPTMPPSRPGRQIAARYQPAARFAEIGGDFYELIQLDGDRLLVAIGDVCGHATHAATVMVELRHALRAYAADGHPPAEILTRLERMMAAYHPDEYATLCLLVLDEARDEIAVANAGHLPPLLVDGAGARYPDIYGPMLGLRRPHAPATVLPLPAPAMLVLITDGLVEAPGTDIDDGLDAVRASVRLDADPESLCTELLDRFGRERRDDIAVLVLRRSG